jgi:O-antigen ligase
VSFPSLAHPNSAAMLFALVNLVTFARVVQGGAGTVRQVALLALFLVAQASTGSLGGIAAMIVMILVYLFARPVRRADRIALTTAGLGIGAAILLSSRIGTERLTEFVQPAPNKENSFEWRVAAWGDVLAAWRRHVLLGNGLGSTLAETIVAGNIPHNEYVRLLAEVGLVGFLATIAIALAVAGSIARRAHRSARPQAAALALAALAGTAVNALAANTMLYSASFYVTMLIVGGCWRILRETPTDPAVGVDVGHHAGRHQVAPPHATATGVPARSAARNH